MKRSQVLHDQKMEGVHVLFFISTDNEGMKSELTGIMSRGHPCQREGGDNP
jgi:hypothetical protein